MLDTADLGMEPSGVLLAAKTTPSMRMAGYALRRDAGTRFGARDKQMLASRKSVQYR